MFEKEAEKYAERTKTEKEIEVLNTVHDWGQESLSPSERRLFEGIQDRERAREQGFKDGAEFGYNKANEWHYVKDGDLPKDEDWKWCVSYRGYYYVAKYEEMFGCWTNQEHSEVMQPYAWKEIVLPKESE